MLTNLTFMHTYEKTNVGILNKCKKLWFIQGLTAHDTSKTAKITKKVITHQHIA